MGVPKDVKMCVSNPCPYPHTREAMKHSYYVDGLLAVKQSAMRTVELALKIQLLYASNLVEFR